MAPISILMCSLDSKIKSISIRKCIKSNRWGRELKDNLEEALKNLRFITNLLQIQAREIKIVILTKLLSEGGAHQEREKMKIIILQVNSTEVTMALILSWPKLTLISQWGILKDNGLQASKMHLTCPIIEVLGKTSMLTNNSSNNPSKDLVGQIEDTMEHRIVIQALSIQATTLIKPTHQIIIKESTKI